jgi:hypothetical protein
MDRTATPKIRLAEVEREFECSRMSEEVLASAYERLLPIVRQLAGLPEEPKQSCDARQPRQARRA